MLYLKGGEKMKFIAISDIHGIKTNLPKIKEKFNELKCDKLVVLGDLFYIGPRNQMIEGYDIEYVKDFLNSFKDKIICIKGNCDSEVDSLVCKFPIINELGMISTINEDIYLTHGHLFNESNWSVTYSTLIYGHLHVPFIKSVETNTYINPGSISLPKNGNKPSYLYFDEDEFIIYDVDDNIIDRKKLN